MDPREPHRSEAEQLPGRELKSQGPCGWTETLPTPRGCVLRTCLDKDTVQRLGPCTILPASGSAGESQEPGGNKMDTLCPPGPAATISLATTLAPSIAAGC